MIKITLQKTIEKHGISPNHLAQESIIRPATIYNILDNKVKSITFKTLTAIISTLRRLTNDDSIDVSDVFIYQDETE